MKDKNRDKEHGQQIENINEYGRDTGPPVSVSTSNISGLNAQIKRQIVRVDQKTRSNYVVYRKFIRIHID